LLLPAPKGAAIYFIEIPVSAKRRGPNGTLRLRLRSAGMTEFFTFS